MHSVLAIVIVGYCGISDPGPCDGQQRALFARAADASVDTKSERIAVTVASAEGAGVEAPTSAPECPTHMLGPTPVPAHCRLPWESICFTKIDAQLFWADLEKEDMRCRQVEERLATLQEQQDIIDKALAVKLDAAEKAARREGYAEGYAEGRPTSAERFRVALGWGGGGLGAGVLTALVFGVAYSLSN